MHTNTKITDNALVPEHTLFAAYGDIVTVEDLMQMLSVGRNTAYSLVKDGTIKSIKVKKQIRIPKKCVIDFLEKNIQRDRAS